MSDKEAIIRNNPTTEKKSYFNRLPKNFRLKYFTKYNFKGLEETPECMLFRVAVLLLDIVIDDALMTAIVENFINCMANEKSFIDTFTYYGVFYGDSPSRNNEEIARLIRFCDLMNEKLTQVDKETYKTEIQAFVSSCDNHYKNRYLHEVLLTVQYQEKASDPSAYTSSSPIRDRSRSPSHSHSPLPPPSNPGSSKFSKTSRPESVVRIQNQEKCRYDGRCNKYNDLEHMARFAHPSSKRRKLGGKQQTIIKKRYSSRRRRQSSKRTTKRNRY